MGTVVWVLYLAFALDGAPTPKVVADMPTEANCVNALKVAQAVVTIIRSKGINYSLIKGTCTRQQKV